MCSIFVSSKIELGVTKMKTMRKHGITVTHRDNGLREIGTYNGEEEIIER